MSSKFCTKCELLVGDVHNPKCPNRPSTKLQSIYTTWHNGTDAGPAFLEEEDAQRWVENMEKYSGEGGAFYDSATLHSKLTDELLMEEFDELPLANLFECDVCRKVVCQDGAEYVSDPRSRKPNADSWASQFYVAKACKTCLDGLVAFLNSQDITSVIPDTDDDE